VRLILASSSPRRADLLRSAGFVFDVVVAGVDESLRAGEPPPDYVRRLAAAKSLAALEQLQRGPGRPEQPYVVLGADTSVVVDGEILGKPADDGEAAEMLRRLSGRWHEVLTGVSLRSGADEIGAVATTRVEMASLAPDEIAAYVTSGDGRDKAGAYAVQGLAKRFIPRMDGSYTNVVGLPIMLVKQLLKAFETRYPLA
jgi:septum formation protein